MIGETQCILTLINLTLIETVIATGTAAAMKDTVRVAAAARTAAVAAVADSASAG